MTLVLLPGMDGTGVLFRDFVRRLPRGITTRIVSYPGDVYLTYEQLAERVADAIPRSTPYLILAESYSGPVASLIAARRVGNLAAVIFVSSFVAFPCGRFFSRIAGVVPGGWLSRLPGWLLRWFLLDTAMAPERVLEIQEVISGVQPDVLSKRLRDALSSDFREALRKSGVRIVCLCGTRDRVLGMRGVRGFLSARGDAEIVRVAGPHFLLQCAPDHSLAALQQMSLLEAAGHASDETPPAGENACPTALSPE